MTSRQTGRRVKTGIHGTSAKITLTQNRRKVLALAEKYPGKSIRSLAAEAGLGDSTIDEWLREASGSYDREFTRRFRAIKRMQSGERPQDPGDFIPWRRRYVNIRSQNPYTGKWAQIGETYPFMVPFIDSLNDPEAKRVLALLPVRHGKTTIIEHLIVWYLCRNPDARVIVVCRTLDAAEERLYKVKQILEDEDMYPELHQQWGTWIGKPDSMVTTRAWQARKFYVRGNSGKQRSPSVRGYGISASTYGARADLIILDDVDDPETEVAARTKILRTVNSTIVNRLDDGGKMVIIGTRCGPGDIYGPLLESPMYEKHVNKAIQDDGTALCPEMYGIDELEAFRQETDFIDPALFLMSYQNEVSSPLDAMFTPELLDRSRGDYTLGEAPDTWPRTIILDPAATGTAAVVTLAHDGDDIRVIDVVAHRAPGYKGIYDMLAGALFRHHPQVCVIEESGATFITDYPAIDLLLKEHGVKMERFHTGSNKMDPRFGIGLVKSRFEMGLLTYAWGDLDAQQSMRPLVNELLTWRPTGRGPKDHHWDRTMALWMGVNVICTGTWSRFAHFQAVLDPLVTKHPYMMRKRQREAAGATKMHVQDEYRAAMTQAGVTTSQHL